MGTVTSGCTEPKISQTLYFLYIIALDYYMFWNVKDNCTRRADKAPEGHQKSGLEGMGKHLKGNREEQVCCSSIYRVSQCLQGPKHIQGGPRLTVYP